MRRTLARLRESVPAPLLAIAAIGLASLALLLVAAFGPNLPGPDVGDWLGIDEPAAVFEPCTAADVEVQQPAGGAPGRWADAGRFPEAKVEVRGAAVDGRIYAVSGLLQGERDVRSSADLSVMQPGSGRFQPAPKLPQELDHTDVASYDGDLYVVGGFSLGGVTPRVWRFSPETGEYTRLADLQRARGAHGVAVAGDKMYVVGGLLKDDLEGVPFGELEIYDFDSDSWSKGASIPTPRHHLGMATAGGRVYAVGGRRPGDLSLETVESYDPRTDTWREEPPLPQGVGGLAVASTGDRLLAIGGGDDDDGWVTGATFELDTKGGGWKRLPDLRVPRYAHAAAAVGDRVYAFGGTQCIGRGRTTAVESLEVG